MTGPVDALLARMAQFAQRTALIQQDGRPVSYAEVRERVAGEAADLSGFGIAGGDVVALVGEFDVRSIAREVALWQLGCTVALLPASAPDIGELLSTAQAQWMVRGAACEPVCTDRAKQPHPLLAQLRAAQAPGLVLFTSGLTGRPKAVLHDVARFLAPYERADKGHVTIGLLLFDHVAGQDTAFYTLHAGGTLVALADRRAETVSRAIFDHGAEVLPASPSFLRLLCLDAGRQQARLGSLRIVTYGSEPMDESTLARLRAILPEVRFIQKYGTSEFSVVPARTRSDDGLWLEFDRSRVGIRVEDGLLWIKAPTTMIGYLGDEASPIRDGWICTGDSVMVEGPWIRILGRASEIINVGGEKLFPAEVEDVIRTLPEIEAVKAFGADHPLLGKVVAVEVRAHDRDADPVALRKRVRAHCAAQLPRYKVPVKIDVTAAALVSERQKTTRAR